MCKYSEEEKDEAFSRGLSFGLEDGYNSGYNQGLNRGFGLGVKKGKYDGFHKGVREGELLIVKRMLNKNVDISIIESCTDLEEKEILKLKNKN